MRAGLGALTTAGHVRIEWRAVAPVGSIEGGKRVAMTRQRSDMDKKAKTPKKPKQNKAKTAK